MQMGVQIPPAQLSGTLRGESACTLLTQEWEMSVRPDPGRTLTVFGRSRSAAAGTVDHGLLAHLVERLPCKQEASGSTPERSTRQVVPQDSGMRRPY